MAPPGGCSGMCPGIPDGGCGCWCASCCCCGALLRGLCCRGDPGIEFLEEPFWLGCLEWWVGGGEGWCRVEGCCEVWECWGGGMGGLRGFGVRVGVGCRLAWLEVVGLYVGICTNGRPPDMVELRGCGWYPAGGVASGDARVCAIQGGVCVPAADPAPKPPMSCASFSASFHFSTEISSAYRLMVMTSSSRDASAFPLKRSFSCSSCPFLSTSSAIRSSRSACFARRSWTSRACSLRSSCTSPSAMPCGGGGRTFCFSFRSHSSSNKGPLRRASSSMRGPRFMLSSSARTALCLASRVGSTLALAMAWDSNSSRLAITSS
mmetsp:Transcript_19209/g.53775  ORF Transcript_19209/g.53775 Transcript_19209/m.53775 type:complete len:320 (+) Transcript_19209:1521-2480(+)